MPRYDVWFILIAALCLTVGIVLGIGMGIAHDFQLAPVHAHLNLLGWASLALFGAIYRLYPALGRTWLAPVHFACSAGSALIFPLGIYLSIAHGSVGLAIAASLIALGGVVLFLVNFALAVVIGSTRVRAGERASLA